MYLSILSIANITQLAGVVEYTDCTFTEEYDPTQCVSWIWHKTIWWWSSSNAGALESIEYPFIAITSNPTLAWSGSTW